MAADTIDAVGLAFAATTLDSTYRYETTFVDDTLTVLDVKTLVRRAVKLPPSHYLVIEAHPMPADANHPRPFTLYSVRAEIECPLRVIRVDGAVARRV